MVVALGDPLANVRGNEAGQEDKQEAVTLALQIVQAKAKQKEARAGNAKQSEKVKQEEVAGEGMVSSFASAQVIDMNGENAPRESVSTTSIQQPSSNIRSTNSDTLLPSQGNNMAGQAAIIGQVAEATQAAVVQENTQGDDGAEGSATSENRDNASSSSSSSSPHAEIGGGERELAVGSILAAVVLEEDGSSHGHDGNNLNSVVSTPNRSLSCSGDGGGSSSFVPPPPQVDSMVSSIAASAQASVLSLFNPASLLYAASGVSAARNVKGSGGDGDPPSYIGINRVNADLLHDGGFSGSSRSEGNVESADGESRVSAFSSSSSPSPSPYLSPIPVSQGNGGNVLATAMSSTNPSVSSLSSSPSPASSPLLPPPHPLQGDGGWGSLIGYGLALIPVIGGALAALSQSSYSPFKASPGRDDNTPKSPLGHSKVLSVSSSPDQDDHSVPLAGQEESQAGE